MSLTAAASGFVVFLLSVQVIQGKNDWEVTYNSTQICALKGSTVEINCTFRYPSRVNGRNITVDKTFWFTQMNGNVPVDLRTDSKYLGRVQYSCYEMSCTLRITDLRESDSSEYKFRFITNCGSWTGWTGVTLNVTGLQVSRSETKRGELECQSRCHPPGHPFYVWYKNGQKTPKETYFSYYSDYFSYTESYSCAVKEHEDFPSPSVCVNRQNCNRVTYSDRSVCAFKGSSVDISCTYNSYNSYGISTFWFSPERHHHWWHSQPDDLRKDPQYTRRVHVIAGRAGRSTLRITDLRESDSAEYRFKFSAGSFEWTSSLPGTTLTVTDAPKPPSASVSPSAEIVEGSSVTLTCSSDANPAAKYTWYKESRTLLTKDRQLVLSSVQSSDSGEYYCAAENELGRRTSENVSINVKYPPKPPSVSVSPSGEIVEGTSVNLSCSSDANPAATYTWYKENQTLIQEDLYLFPFIGLEDTGIYYCKSENEYGQISSTSVHINVLYPPKPPSVSVSPSAEIMEGSSVTLSCSSDANPAATYTWYKENEDSPKASGQNFSITDIRAEHSGSYYCEAQNSRGRHNSTLHLTVVAGSMKSVAAGSITAIFLAIIFLCAFLLIRRKRSSKQSAEPGERPDHKAQLNMGSAALQRKPAEEPDDLFYTSVSFSVNQEDPLYSNIGSARPNRHISEEEEEDEDGVEYTIVNVKSARAPQELRRQEEDSSALYSTVTKKPSL
ncbi:Fc receptor-like protein 2 [Enoplosus armatus]|uniref:Fc receptor-like protein 2 n=1 Tax=Enoplosus armatus TaxID=215367 RepID=UPI003993E8CD